MTIDLSKDLEKIVHNCFSTPARFYAALEGIVGQVVMLLFIGKLGGSIAEARLQGRK